MDAGPKSEKTLDVSNMSSELLLLTLQACRAGLFYSPLTMEAKQDANLVAHARSLDPAWSLNFAPLFGLPETPKDVSGLLPYMLESDQHILMECVARAVNENIRESEIEYRIRRPDNGEVRWLMSRLLVGVDDQGGARYLASMCFDITEQKQAQQHLEEENAKLDAAQKYLLSALKSAGIAIFRYTINPENVQDLTSLASWNYNLATLFGLPADVEMTPELQMSRMRPEDCDTMVKKGIESITTKNYEFEFEFPIQWDDHSKHWLLSKCTIEFDENGQPQYASGAIIDITDRKLAEEKMQYIATHDVLTALPNRFMFSNLLNHTIETAKRYVNRFAVFFIDLDRFKAINDAFGHQAGDQLLKETAQRIRKCLRTSDVLARISGDEFVVLAPEVDNEEGAAVIARKIIAEVGQPMILLGKNCHVTASIGICLYPDQGDDEETLIKNADSAMYAAKEAGKNNYQFFNERAG